MLCFAIFRASTRRELFAITLLWLSVKPGGWWTTPKQRKTSGATSPNHIASPGGGRNPSLNNYGSKFSFLSITIATAKESAKYAPKRKQFPKWFVRTENNCLRCFSGPFLFQFSFLFLFKRSKISAIVKDYVFFSAVGYSCKHNQTDIHIRSPGWGRGTLWGPACLAPAQNLPSGWSAGASRAAPDMRSTARMPAGHLQEQVGCQQTNWDQKNMGGEFHIYTHIYIHIIHTYIYSRFSGKFDSAWNLSLQFDCIVHSPRTFR